MIDSLFQDTTDKVLDDQLQRPRAAAPQKTAFSLWGMARGGAKGVGGGVAEGIAFGAEVASAFGQVEGSYPEAFGIRLTDEQKQQAEAARRKVLTQGVDMSSEAGDLFRSRAKEIMPDPNTTHEAEQVTAGLTNFVTKAVGYSLTGGPAAPILLGGDAALTEADKLKQQGVDLETRAKAGAVAGTVAGASIVLPVVGSTVLKTAGLVAAAGPGSFVAQNAATKAILDNAGYKDIANQYNPFDPVGLTVSTLVPTAFGAAALRMRAGRGEPAKPAGALNTEADVKQSVQLTPAEQATSDAFEASPANLAELRGAIAKEKNPENRALLQAELAKQEAAAAHGEIRSAIEQHPEIVDAARVKQVADTMDAQRLTRDGDLAGMALHQDALARAQDQINAGEKVSVADMLADRELDAQRVTEARDRLLGPLEDVIPADDAHVGRLAPDQQAALRDRYARASRDKPAFDSTISDIARELGGKAGLADLKGTARAIDKIMSDYGGDASRIKDVLRATIEVPASNAQQAIAALRERFNIAQSGQRNLFDPAMKTADGYRDAKFNVELNGHVAEIQVNTPEMLAAKKKAHGFYEEREALTRSIGDRIPTAEERARIAELNAQMRAIYEPAWAEATSARKAPSDSGAPLRRADEASNERGGTESQAAEYRPAASAPSDTGMPSTSKNSASGSNLAGRTEAADSRFISTSEQNVPDLTAQLADIQRENPNLQVQIDGMDGPVSAAQLLEQVKAEAAAEIADAPLLQVAANCFLRG